MMSFTSRRTEVLTAESLGKAQVLSAFARLDKATRPDKDEAVQIRKTYATYQ